MDVCRPTSHLGSQSPHGGLSVLVLGTVALAEGHEARRQVGDADGAVGGVDVLPPRPLRAHGVHLEILGGDLDRGGRPCRTGKRAAEGEGETITA